MIFCILGYTGSGKDTITKEVSRRLNIPIVVSNTTRPMRPKERYGIEYYFLDEKTFEENKNNMLAIREYEVWNGSKWKYGINKSEFNHKNCLLIIDAKGYEEIKNYFGENNVFAFFLDTSAENILLRTVERGDNEKEVLRRLEDDIKKFKSFFNNNWDYCMIDNDKDKEFAINAIEKTIDYTYL